MVLFEVFLFRAVAKMAAQQRLLAVAGQEVMSPVRRWTRQPSSSHVFDEKLELLAAEAAAVAADLWVISVTCFDATQMQMQVEWSTQATQGGHQSLARCWVK